MARFDTIGARAKRHVDERRPGWSTIAGLLDKRNQLDTLILTGLDLAERGEDITSLPMVTPAAPLRRAPLPWPVGHPCDNGEVSRPASPVRLAGGAT